MRIRIGNIDRYIQALADNKSLQLVFYRMSKRQKQALAKIRVAGISVVKIEEVLADKIRITFLMSGNKRVSVSFEDLKDNKWRINSFDGLMSTYSKPMSIDNAILLAKSVQIPELRTRSAPKDTFNADRNLLEASIMEKFEALGLPKITRIGNNRVGDVAFKFETNSILAYYRVYAYISGVLEIISIRTKNKRSGIVIYSTKNFNNLVTKLRSLMEDEEKSKDIYV